MVMDCPLPSMVKLIAMAGRALPSVIVPLTLKLMVSPGKAARISSRRLPAPVSLVLVTVSVAARANPDIARNKAGTTISATTKLRIRSALDPSTQRLWLRRQISTSFN